MDEQTREAVAVDVAEFLAKLSEREIDVESIEIMRITEGQYSYRLEPRGQVALDVEQVSV